MTDEKERVTITCSSGEIDVTEDAMMTFPVGGLFGFEGVTRYAMLPAARRGMWWLFSDETPSTCFVLADPFVLDAGYEIDLNERERSDLQIQSPNDVLVLVMLTLPSGAASSPTANMKAPIVFNITKRLAAQIVTRNEQHILQYPADISEYPLMEPSITLG